MQKLKISVLIFILAFIVNGCASSKPANTTAYHEKFLKKLCEHYGISLQWDHISQLITLTYEGKETKILVGSPMAIVNGDAITLSGPVVMIESSIVVPADFIVKVVEPMRVKSTAPAYPSLAIREVIIDPGHGGKDPGAVGVSGAQEKDIVLDIAKRLKKILENRGLRVIMTRETDVFISLQERTEIASRSKADLFISIHANSSLVQTVYGIEVFSLKGLSSLEQNEAQREMNHQILFKSLTMKRHNENLEKILADMLYSYKQAESHELADHAAEKISRFVKTKNRGMKYARFYVLRNTLIPAVLVEVGFLSNTREERLLANGLYRQKVADGLAKSILEYVIR